MAEELKKILLKHRLSDILTAIREIGINIETFKRPGLSSDKKLSRLEINQELKDIIMPIFVHYIRRYLANHEEPGVISPEDILEKSMFELLSHLLDQDRDISLNTYQEIVQRYDSLKTKHKIKFFNEEYLDLPLKKEVSHQKVAEDLAFELIGAFKQRYSFVCPPGKVRQETTMTKVSSPDGDIMVEKENAPSIKLWKINELRGADIEPAISPSLYLDDEVEKECEYKEVEKDEKKFIQITCDTKNFYYGTGWEGEHVGNICLRIPELAVNEQVTLIGSNFFDDQCIVRIRHKGDPNISAGFKCWVCGDVATPVNDTTGELINDTRVSDRLSFFIDVDTWTSKNMPAGIYNLEVGVPNTINWSITQPPPDMFWSKSRPVKVLPMQGDYKVLIDELYCQQETQPGDTVASDEVGIIVQGVEHNIRTGVVAPWQQMEDSFNNSGLEDVDTGDTVKLELYLLGSAKNYKRISPDSTIAVGMCGYDIDDDDIYKDNVKGAWEVFQAMWNSEAWITYGIGGAITFANLVGWISSIAAGWAGAIVTAVKFVISLLLSWWAAPDEIIKDALDLNPSKLDFLTRLSTQLPMDYRYEEDGIKVHVIPTNKKLITPLTGSPYVEYIEYREYRETDTENSTYRLRLKYSRKM